MFVTKTEPQISVPATEGTVLTVQGPATAEKHVVLHNLDGASTLTYRFQSSDDGSTWVDVAADATLAPGLELEVELTGATFHRLRASGNLNIAAKVDASVAFLGTFTFIAS